MNFWRRLFSRKPQWEQELSEELRFHIEHQTSLNIAAGMPRDQARRQAMLQLGGVDGVKEHCREERTGFWLESCWTDVRYGARVLRKSPGFTLTAILILALGIGSNAAVFGLIDVLLLRNLAVPEPQELVHISFGPPGNTGPLSGPMFDRLRERQGAFNDLFAWTNSPMILTENGVSRPIQAAYATGSAFPTLKIKPRLGRLLDWDDDEPDRNSMGFAAVISEMFWLQHFGGNPAVLGQTIVVNGAPATIVGVMPRSFSGITVDYAPGVVLPFAFDVGLHGKLSARFLPESRWLFTMGRLKPGVRFTQAQANLATIAGDVLTESLRPNYSTVDILSAARFSLSPGATGNSPLGEIYARPLWTLQALVGLLLLICCANLAGLQLSRSLNRQQELVVRTALGAGRLRLVRQLVAESAMLAIAGAAAGIVLSQWMSSLLVRYVEQSDFPVYLDLRPHALIFAWTASLAAITLILAGALPALSVTRFDGEAMLNCGTQRSVAFGTNRLAARLLPMQVALSILLVSVALLFAVSSARLLRTDPGFRVKGVTLFGVDFERRAEKGEARVELYRRMLDVIRRAPGVESSSVLAIRPLGEDGIEQSAAAVEGSGLQDKHLFQNIVGQDYFATAGTRVLEGREFSDLDRFGSAPVCIVNQSAAKFFFPGQDALGKHIRSTMPEPSRPLCEIVGVVVDAKYNSVREPAPRTIYYSYEQVFSDVDPGFITRSKNTSFAVAAFNDALDRFAPDTPLLPAVTMQRQLEDSVGQERLLAALSLFFGGVALVLTCVGLYGLEMQRVTQRTAEIGLRMALGAQKDDVLWFVLRETALLFIVGIPIGLVLAAGASRFVESLLYDLSPFEPRIHLAAALAVLAAGLLAAYLPARRAVRIDPMVALRHE